MLGLTLRNDGSCEITIDADVDRSLWRATVLNIVSLTALVIGGITFLFALHRLGLWMEKRGWIYYKHTRSGGVNLGNALMQAQVFLQPEIQHTIEVLHEDHASENFDCNLWDPLLTDPTSAFRRDEDPGTNTDKLHGGPDE